jgi:hypothetical protein
VRGAPWSRQDLINHKTTDHDHYGIAFSELVDVVLGTSETLPAWAEALNRCEAEGPDEHPGIPSVTARAELAELRARSLLRERFGDLGIARDVLRGLADLLDQLEHETEDAAARGEDVADIAQPGQVPSTPPGP